MEKGKSAKRNLCAKKMETLTKHMFFERKCENICRDEKKVVLLQAE